MQKKRGANIKFCPYIIDCFIENNISTSFPKRCLFRRNP